MPIKHDFQSGRGDNGDAGAVQPSQWNADHILEGMLAIFDALSPTPNTVVTLDGSNNLFLKALSDFATTFSPHLSGVPTAPTAPAGTNSTQIATMEAVQTAITNLIGGAPGALNTLKELADAINDDASFAATVTAALAVRLRVDVNNQGLSGTQQTNARTNLGLGNAATLTAGTGPSNVVQLDGSSKLPAVDGSQLTNIPFTGAIRYDQVLSPTADQKAIAQANAGGVPFTGTIVESHVSSAMTIAVKTPSGVDASASTPVVARFQLTTGSFAEVAVTAALSITIPSATTLGHSSGIACPIYIYAIKNGTAVELALSAKYFGKSGTVSTSAISGGNTSTTMYSTAARAAVPFVLLGVAYSTQTTAGTWAASPASIELGKVNLKAYAFQADMNGTNGTTNGLVSLTATKATGVSRANFDPDSAFDTTNSKFVCREPGQYSFTWQWGTVESVNGYVHSLIFKNASQVIGGPTSNAGGGFAPIASVTTDLLLVPGDVIEFYCRQTDASAKTLLGAAANTFVTGKMVRAPH